jgi:hypothetical protein
MDAGAAMISAGQVADATGSGERFNADADD